jgi:hypothetical protein
MVLVIGFIKPLSLLMLAIMIFTQQLYIGPSTQKEMINGLKKQQEIFLVEKLHKNMNVVLMHQAKL